MRKLLITVLAGIMMASLSFGKIISKDTLTKEAAAKSMQLNNLSAGERRTELLKMFQNDRIDNAKASKILESLEIVYKGKEAMLVDAISLFSKAREAEAKEVVDLARALDHLLLKVSETNTDPVIIKDLVGSAKLAISEMDPVVAKKVESEIIYKTWQINYNFKAIAGNRPTIDSETSDAFTYLKYVRGENYSNMKDMTERLKPEELNKIKEEARKKKEECAKAI